MSKTSHIHPNRVGLFNVVTGEACIHCGGTIIKEKDAVVSRIGSINEYNCIGITGQLCIRCFVGIHQDECLVHRFIAAEYER